MATKTPPKPPKSPPKVQKPPSDTKTTSQAKSPASTKPAKQQRSSYPNCWSVLGKIVEEVFGLINTNKIYPAFAMMFLFIAMLIIYRLPPNELGPLLRWGITTLGASTGGLAFLLVSTNLLWKRRYDRQRELYKEEIKRLIDVRHDLMHGKITPIVNHRSTDDAQEEVYLLPPESGKRIQNGREK